MANLTVAPAWSGIYQLETSDPVQAGPDGILNVPPAQLGNRTEYLKLRADQVDDARGAHATLKARIDAIEGSRGIVAQGSAFIKNKFVVSGMVLTKDAAVRTLHLSASGVVGAGVSRVYTDGQVVAIPDDDHHVAVPTNESASPKTYYAYFRRSAMRVQIGTTVPEDGLLLYTLVVPAGDVDSLAGVTLANGRIIQSVDAWASSFTPSVTVPLAVPVPDVNYAVHMEVESATNRSAVGALTAYDKAVNAFKIKSSGSADNIRVRWTLTRLAA